MLDHGSENCVCFFATIILVHKPNVWVPCIFLNTYNLENFIFKFYWQCIRSNYIATSRKYNCKFLNHRNQLFLTNDLFLADECAENDWFEDQCGGQAGIPEQGAVFIPALSSMLWSLFTLFTCQQLFVLWEKRETGITRVTYMLLPGTAVSFDLQPWGEG